MKPKFVFSPLMTQIFIVIGAIILFVPFLGSVHLFDWDEINFAECAREMILTEDYFSVTINFQPFWEKPPLFIWMQAIAMKMFGVNAFAARLPNAVCGMITLLFLYNVGRKLFDERFAIFWVIAFVGSFLPHFYFKSGIIDPWFNLLIFAGIVYFIYFLDNKAHRHLIISALCIGLAVLTKGPVAILIFGLCISVFWMMGRCKPLMSWTQLLLFGFMVASVGCLWFVMLALSGHSDIITEFFVYQVRLFQTRDAGHGGPFIYHWLVLLIGCFPASIFALNGFLKDKTDSANQLVFATWMKIMFWVVLILFSIVKTKIIHYSSLCYFPLTFLSVWWMYKFSIGKFPWRWWTNILLLLIGGLWSIALVLLPLIDRYKTDIIASGWIKDDFAIENLKASVSWQGWEWMIGCIFFIGISIVMVGKKIGNKGFGYLFLLSILCIQLASLIITPKVEKYSQGAAISFYESLQGQDCYIETIGFKSYAHLFYSAKQPQQNTNYLDKEWLLTGKIDKPAYFVAKITSAEDIKQNYPLLKEIKRTNGFVFYKRLVE